MLYLGIVAGIFAGNAAAHAAGLDAFRVYVATLVLVAGGMLGSRLFYVAAHWRLTRANLWRVWRRDQAGAVQYGGFITALLLSVPVLAGLRLPFGAYWDTEVFTILVAVIFGRVGCLLHGCCCGCASESWISLYLPNRFGVWSRRIPTQCLEACWSLVLLLAAIVVRPWLPVSGALFWAVLGGHASGRFVLEPTREEQARSGLFAPRQITSIVFILLSLTALAARWHK
jgi:phosphatidylglycerol---prolipoprotein diacylglyceryl transferase